MRYLRLYRIIASLSFSSHMAHRLNLLIWGMLSLLNIVVQIVFFKVLTSYSSDINGWAFNDLLVLGAVSAIFQGICSLTFMPMMYGLSYYVKQGELDQYIFKPVDTLFLLTFRWVDFEDIMNVIGGVILLAVVVISTGITVTWLQILLFVFGLIVGAVILYSMLVIALSFAFVFTSIGAVAELTWTFVGIGNIPVHVFKGFWGFLLTFVLPIGLMVTVPAEVILDRGRYLPLLGYGFVLAVVLLLTSRRFFYRMMRRYEGVSS